MFALLESLIEVFISIYEVTIFPDSETITKIILRTIATFDSTLQNG